MSSTCPKLSDQYELQADEQRTCVQEACDVETVNTEIGIVTSKVGGSRIEPTFGDYNKHLTGANIDNPYPISCAHSTIFPLHERRSKPEGPNARV